MNNKRMHNLRVLYAAAKRKKRNKRTARRVKEKRKERCEQCTTCGWESMRDLGKKRRHGLGG